MLFTTVFKKGYGLKAPEMLGNFFAVQKQLMSAMQASMLSSDVTYSLEEIELVQEP